MKKWIHAGTISVTTLAVLSGCQKESDTERQIAQLQNQLQAERNERAQREEKERAEAERRAQEEHEARIRQEAEDTVRAELEAAAASRAAAESAEQIKASQNRQTQQNASPHMQNGMIRERIVRYPATVVTQSGYGSLSLRGSASTQGLEIGRLSDGEEITVIAKSNLCQVIANIEGCWVKVETAGGIKGYMFDGYLNREIFSQSEKESLQGQVSEKYSEEYNYY